MLNALKGYSKLRQSAESASALAELLACLVAYNYGPDGTVTPRSCCQGYAEFSFGRKKRPSPWATAYQSAVLAAYDDLAIITHAVDVRASSSRGGSGIALPPR